MKKLLLLSTIAFLSMFTACSSDDSSPKTEEDSSQPKKRVVVAVLDNQGSVLNVQTANANTTKDYVTAGSGYQHRVLIEDFTGAWCGWCPRVTFSIEELVKTNNDKIVAVALHNQDKFAFTPHENNLYVAIANKIGVDISKGRSFPFATLNRTARWNGGTNTMNEGQVLALSKPSSPIGIKIASELGDTSGKINVSLKFNEDYTNLKYVVYVVEDNLILAQENYTTNYGGKGKKKDFVHNDVVKAVNNVLGENVTNSTSGSEFNSGEINFTYKKFENVK